LSFVFCLGSIVYWLLICFCVLNRVYWFFYLPYCELLCSTVVNDFLFILVLLSIDYWFFYLPYWELLCSTVVNDFFCLLSFVFCLGSWFFCLYCVSWIEQSHAFVLFWQLKPHEKKTGINSQVFLNKESLKSSSVLLGGGYGRNASRKNLFQITEKLEVAVLLIVIKPLFHSFKSIPFITRNFFLDEWLIYKFMLFQSPLFKNYRILRVDNHWFDLMWRFKSFLIDLCKLLPNNVNSGQGWSVLIHSFVLFRVTYFCLHDYSIGSVGYEFPGWGQRAEICMQAILNEEDEFIYYWLFYYQPGIHSYGCLSKKGVLFSIYLLLLFLFCLMNKHGLD